MLGITTKKKVRSSRSSCQLNSHAPLGTRPALSRTCSDPVVVRRHLWICPTRREVERRATSGAANHHQRKSSGHRQPAPGAAATVAYAHPATNVGGSDVELLGASACTLTTSSPGAVGPRRSYAANSATTHHSTTPLSRPPPSHRMSNPLVGSF